MRCGAAKWEWLLCPLRVRRLHDLRAPTGRVHCIGTRRGVWTHMAVGPFDACMMAHASSYQGAGSSGGVAPDGSRPCCLPWFPQEFALQAYGRVPCESSCQSGWSFLHSRPCWWGMRAIWGTGSPGSSFSGAVHRLAGVLARTIQPHTALGLWPLGSLGVWEFGFILDTRLLIGVQTSLIEVHPRRIATWLRGVAGCEAVCVYKGWVNKKKMNE